MAKKGDKALQSLKTYGRDMVEDAKTLDPVIGRDKEIREVVTILCQRNKRNLVLTGEAGVGKTAVVEGLAKEIFTSKVPMNLRDVKLIALDVGALLAGAQYRGDFEKRLKQVLKAVEESNGKIILFIDEIHLLLGAGRTEGPMDAANLLKPMLARGQLRCIGATTGDEYRKYVEKDAAFARRFQEVYVAEQSVLQTINILHGVKDKYESYHGVKIKDTALVSAAELSSKFITERKLPDKAIDLVDRACANVRVQLDSAEPEEIDIPKGKITGPSGDLKQDAETVGPKQIAEVVSSWTGIPVTRLYQNEEERLRGLADRLRERVVGQEVAIQAIHNAMLIWSAGLGTPGKPIGSFLFFGPPGVGKTKLAKALAAELFDDEDKLVRIDMSEYTEKDSISKLIGAPPGLIGYEERGQLTEAVRKRSHSVVLFDEVEKAHNLILNILLQVIDDGRLTDNQGRTVSFSNTIIIMTSNVGEDEVTEKFSPELLDRLPDGHKIKFDRLSRDDLKEIVARKMTDVESRLKGKCGASLQVTKGAYELVFEQNYKHGARHLQGWLEKTVVVELAKRLINKEIDDNSTICIDAVDGQQTLSYRVDRNGGGANKRKRNS